jgi:hypothetical protein
VSLVAHFCQLANGYNFDLEYSGRMKVTKHLSDNNVYVGDVFSSGFYPKGNGAVTLMKSWLNTCLKSHASCGIIYDTKFMPSRLIDVGSERQNFVNLTDAWLSSGRPSSKYLTLSHCWGLSMPESAKTTTLNLSRHFRRIRIRKLPKTFRDAIMMTRRLGYRYIWIDSLCIIQNSELDWTHESALMGKIYSHSSCTLAAAGSADCHGGLFRNRKELAIFKESSAPGTVNASPFVLVKNAYVNWEIVFDRSPLNTRGWTLQERELSPRIIYFTKETLLFECREARGNEHGATNGTERLGDMPDDHRAVLTSKIAIRQSHTRRCMDELPLGKTKDGKVQWMLNK